MMKLFNTRLKLLVSTGITVLLLLLLHGSAMAQGPAFSWLQLSPSGTPPVARYSAGHAYDEANDRLILFSGEDFTGLPRPIDVWVLTNASGADGVPTWNQLAPAGTPPLGREGGTTVYDPTSNSLIVHGGCARNCSPALSDVWVLSHANGLGGTPTWTALPNAPISRASHNAVYDPGSNRMIVFGGNQAFFGTNRNDVWVLTSANGSGGTPQWIQLAPTGTPPAPRESSAAVYDQLTNRMIIFGGAQGTSCCVFSADFNDVWILTHANGLGGTPQWIQLNPAGTLPPSRYNHSLVYDSSANQIIAFGGINLANASAPFNDVWILTHANGTGDTSQWIPATPNGSSPLARIMHSVGYSQASKRMIVAMGRNDLVSPSLFNDVWVLVNDTTPPVLNLPADLTVEGNVINGVDLTLPLVTATDDVDPAPVVSCDQTSGFFPLGLTTVTCTATDASGNSSTDSFNMAVMDTSPPDITCPADINETVGQPIGLGWPTILDIVDPNPTVNNNAPDNYPSGATTVTWTATDASGNAASCAQRVSLTYDFSGFFTPVDMSVLNLVKAGQSIPIKFSLNGDQGLDILPEGYPQSQQVACDFADSPNDIIEAVTAGNSSLTYDVNNDQYKFVWKTEKAWAGTCRQLILKLNDNTEYAAFFEFK